MYTDIFDLISKAKQIGKTYSLNWKFEFNPPATLEEILACEELIGLALPESHKKFLMFSNGAILFLQDEGRLRSGVDGIEILSTNEIPGRIKDFSYIFHSDIEPDSPEILANSQESTSSPDQEMNGIETALVNIGQSDLIADDSDVRHSCYVSETLPHIWEIDLIADDSDAQISGYVSVILDGGEVVMEEIEPEEWEPHSPEDGTQETSDSSSTNTIKQVPDLYEPLNKVIVFAHEYGVGFLGFNPKLVDKTSFEYAVIDLTDNVHAYDPYWFPIAKSFSQWLSIIFNSVLLVHEEPNYWRASALSVLPGDIPSEGYPLFFFTPEGDKAENKMLDFSQEAYSKGSEQDYLGAIECYSQAILIHPKSLYYYHRAICKLKTQNWNEVIQDLDKAIELDRGSRDLQALNVFCQRGLVRFHGQDLQGALEDFTTVIEWIQSLLPHLKRSFEQLRYSRNPIYPNTLIFRAEVRIQLQDPIGALTDLVEVARVYELNGIQDQISEDDNQFWIPDNLLAYRNGMTFILERMQTILRDMSERA